MHSVNQATLLGNLTRDPELRYTPSGNAVISFAIATNRYWKNDAGEKQEAVDYHNIVFWGKAAEIIAQYVSKGNKIYIQGRLQTRSWEKDGVKKYSTEVVGKDFILLTPKGKEVPAEEAGEAPPPEEKPSKKSTSEKPKKKTGKNEIDPDDIPF
ncbi:MAG: single-stranded DNA-binding protein [Candidatus Peribacteraceae bacterium]|nr:single-stranded DNA-binding protein [Candidatus Peribacteraceae bacterium]